MEETKQRKREEKQKEFEDRISTDDNGWNSSLWIEYAEWEMKNKSFDRARRVFERALARLPGWFNIWHGYVRMEEMLGNVAGARQVFEKAATEGGWSLGADLWLSYVKFELRNGDEFDPCRAIFERFVQCYEDSPEAHAWIWYANFEEEYGGVGRARNVYERGTESYAELICHGDEMAQSDARAEVKLLLVAFAEFEVRCNEIERARCVYKRAIDQWPMCEALYDKFMCFKKQYGNEDVDDVIERKRYYEHEVRKKPRNYDLWFDYIKLLQQEEEESKGKDDRTRIRIREVYERAISNAPRTWKKRLWKGYICLWISYAVYEELIAQDSERARLVYRNCLDVIPHVNFFASIWLLAAKFEIRQLNLEGARQILGTAIGKAPSAKIFNKYIEMELQLGNVDQCRKLYERYIKWSPRKCNAWIKFAEFEAQAHTDGIDSATQEEKKHCIERARRVFERADNYFTTASAASEFKEEICMLQEEWLSMEASFGDLGDVNLIPISVAKESEKGSINQDGSSAVLG